MRVSCYYRLETLATKHLEKVYGEWALRNKSFNRIDNYKFLWEQSYSAKQAFLLNASTTIASSA